MTNSVRTFAIPKTIIVQWKSHLSKTERCKEPPVQFIMHAIVWGFFFICNISFYIRGVPSSLALKASLEGRKGVASALKTKEIQEEERKKKTSSLWFCFYTPFISVLIHSFSGKQHGFFPCFDWLDRRLPAVSGFICVSAYVLINTIFIPVALTRRRLGAPELLQSCKNCIRCGGG